MFRKSVVLSVIASLCYSIVMWCGQAVADPWAMYRVYAYVQREQVYAILPYMQNSTLLEIEDQNGFTPLCYAVYNQDKYMVQKLVFLGANLNADCMYDLPIEKLRNLGLTRRDAYATSVYSSSRHSTGMSPVFTRKNLFALGLIGGIAGIAALVAALSGGGGGHKGGAVVPSETPLLPEVKTIPAIKHAEACPQGMQLINGVCTTPVTPGADGKKSISIVSDTVPPTYLAEFGGSVSTKSGDDWHYVGTTESPVIAMQADGVSVSALSADGNTVNLSGASSAKNVEGASITMVEESPNDKGVIAMYGPSAGTINNDGHIEIISQSHAESAGMKVDRNDSAGISGIGMNITNNGTIDVTDLGDGMGILSAISAPGRNVINNGKINLTLDTNGGAIDKDTKGTINGIYGRSISNQGTISLNTNAQDHNTAINTDAYLIRGYGDMGSIVANDGNVNIDLTNIAWGIYGVWSDEAAESGVTVSNTGKIDVTGILYNDPRKIQAKHVYLLGAEGGIADITNTGTIDVGKETPVDVSMGGIMNGIYGFSGNMSNQNKINFNLQADPSVSSGAFTAVAMSLDRGNLQNDADITYSFTNEKEGVDHTDQVINLTAINTLSATTVNNANLTATLTGVAADNSSTTGLKDDKSGFTGMHSTEGEMTNTSIISVTSNVDNMDLTAMTADSGSITNETDARISLKTTGMNADLTGGQSGAGINNGYVYLIHNGGSGNIRGFDGGNQGLIQIEANDLYETDAKGRVKSFMITGGKTYTSISEKGEESDVENTTDASGIINISLTGRTSGEVYGYNYFGNNDEPPAYVSANTINIKAESPTRQGDLTVSGITVDGNIASFERNGVMTLNVMGSPTDRTRVVGISAAPSALKDEVKIIKNNEGSVVNLNVNLNGSTSHFITGMETYDNSIYYDENEDLMKENAYVVYQAWNAGTLNLNIKGYGANVLYDSEIPFDIVGMLTNSYALNTGTVNLNVDSLMARTAGMVAYDGGMIINTGTISFTGNAAKFVPMYATGHRRILEETYSYGDEYYTLTRSQKDLYGTIRNSGQIIVRNTATTLIPQGDGYYSNTVPDLQKTPIIDLWARYLLDETYRCEYGGSCALKNRVVDDNRSSFTRFPYPSDDDETELDEPATILATTIEGDCPSGMTIINGVCTYSISGGDGSEPVVDYSETESPHDLAEFGGVITNDMDLEYNGGSAPVVAMQANGVAADALIVKEDQPSVVNLAKASSVINDKDASITMTETAATNQGVIAMYGTSAGSIRNKGDIYIESRSTSESAAMKTDEEVGQGANVINDGTITVADLGDGTGTVSAISAPRRSVVNNGTIDLVLGAGTNSSAKGVMQGLYGKEIVNKGEIYTGIAQGINTTSVNTDVYLMRGFGDTGSTVANDGTIGIDLTHLKGSIYGVWSNPASDSGVSVKNTGNIYVDGVLENSSSSAKHVYLMGTDGGVSDVINSGLISVGTFENPIDVGWGGIMNAMYGFTGTLSNQGSIDFNLMADPGQPSNTFTAHAMSLNEGNLTNDGEITYTFTNEAEGVTSANQVLDFTAVHTNTANATNNGDIRAQLDGYAGADSYFSAMNSEDGDLTNNGLILVDSTMDNVNLTAMENLNTGNATNSSSGQILLKTTGYNANLYGLGGAGTANNSGAVYLIHNGGSGDIFGFGGKNDGLIQIVAHDMETDSDSVISGGGVVPSGGSDSGTVNISLTGRTAGKVYGYEYGADVDNGFNSSSSLTSGTTINITANDPNRSGDLYVYGIRADTFNRVDHDDPVASVDRDGSMTLNVLASPTKATEVVGISGENANIKNNKTSVVNLNVDLNGSTNHFIAGMELSDSTVYDEEHYMLDEFQAHNDGTLNINVTGPGKNTTYADARIPFDVVGMVTNSTALNTGTININVESENAKSAGMVAYDGGMITNRGTISFTGNADNFTPMYATGSKIMPTYTEQEITPIIVDDKEEEQVITYTYNKSYYATIHNSGDIIIKNVTKNMSPKGQGYYSTDPNNDEWANEIIEDVTCTGLECDPKYPQHEEQTNVDQFTPFNAPVSTASAGNTIHAVHQSTSGATTSTPRMLINDGVRYITEAGGSFIADGVHLLGDVTAGTSLVQGSNANTYISSGSGEGAVVGDGDFSDLGLSSNSVMFKASYAQNTTNANGADIVMQRRSFYDLMNNSSLAGFLEHNYSLGNNVAFFDQLKSFDHLNRLNQSLDKFTGKDVLSRFNFEDMTMMRELNFDMNDKIFHNTEDVLETAGSVKSLAFKGDTGSKAKYSLLYKNHGDYSIGVGMAFANIRSDDGHNDNKHQEMLYQMNVPIGTKILGAHLMMSPRFGYARGSYTRTGFNDTHYKGTLEKRVFGLANEIRYPMVFGSWTVEPVSEFNILGYNQRGHEDNKAYSLKIESQNTYSVEAGVGLYVNKTAQLANESTLKLSSGVVVYHEFADPYRLDVGMSGMDGTFTLRDEYHSENRAVVRAGFDYSRENLSLYGTMTSFIDDEVHTNIKSGMNWKF